MKLIQDLDTTGARAAECFVHEGTRYLVIPQLAADVPGQPALMTVGNSDIAAQVYRWQDGRFVFDQPLPMPGGEDAEFFRIGERAFLATASLRTGAGPYDLNAQSVIFELRGGRFEPLQSVPTFAAKQWTHFEFDGRHFLAMAQGAALEAAQPRHPALSTIFEWNGGRFAPFQDIESAWGYNWAFFEAGGERLLAYADHVQPSRILRWDGRKFAAHQELEGKSGRAFCFFESGGHDWLAFACLHDDTWLYRREGSRFTRHQRLGGPGGRELLWMAQEQRLLLVNFLHGTREAPQPSLQSAYFRPDGSGFTQDGEFATLGGTDATAFTEAGVTYLVVTHSLSAQVRFRTPSKVYALDRKE